MNFMKKFFTILTLILLVNTGFCFNLVFSADTFIHITEEGIVGTESIVQDGNYYKLTEIIRRPIVIEINDIVQNCEAISRNSGVSGDTENKIKSSKFVISCVTPPHPPGFVDVQVEIKDSPFMGTKENGFLYVREKEDQYLVKVPVEDGVSQINRVPVENTSSMAIKYVI